MPSRNLRHALVSPTTALLSAALAALLTITAITAITAIAPPAHADNVSGGAPVPPGGVALTWVPAYMSDAHDYTRAEATALARDNDLIAAMPAAFGSYATAMRAANPKVSLLSYANATLAAPGDTSGLGEAAFAHDGDGRRITAPSFGTYLMESSNAAWRARADAQCDDRAARGDYDGCLVDMLTLGIFSKGYVTGTPVNPATGADYTQAQYRDQMTTLAAYYRRQSPGLAHVGNSVENAYRYWQSKEATSQSLANSQPGAQMEDFLRGSGSAATTFPTAADWVRNVDVIRDMESKGTVGLFTTKLWVGAGDARVAQWQAYTMASFLMGAGGRSYLAFTASRDKAGVLGTDLPYTMPNTLGAPSGAMVQQASGAWTRGFGNGMSAVNPTDRSVTIALGSAMRTLDGAVVTSLTLPPDTGQVLLRTAGNQVPDTTAPTVTLGSAVVSGRTVSLSGRVVDDVRAAGVEYAVRNEATGSWLQPNGSWGSYTTRAAALAGSASASTTWSGAVTLAPGRYGFSFIGRDAAGNSSADRPWKVVSVY